MFIMTLFVQTLHAQTGFYSTDEIQQIELFFSQSDWDYRLDTAKNGSGGYLIADSVRINGQTFDSVGVKYKGNSSYDETYVKNPLHIELNTILDQSYNGYTDVKLSNGYGDPSLVREVLAYRILENYADAPQSNFAQVYINQSYVGLYSNTESINKTFCATHFYSSGNTFVKCNPTVIPGPTTKSNLRYISTDSADYTTYYEMKSDAGWSDLLEVCNVVTNSASNLETLMDVDRAIWMLAFNNVVVNLDSYSGVFAQNYYLYQDDNGRFNPIIWDLNMSFGGFPYLGSGNNSMGSLTVANMQQLPLTAHSNDTYWPLIKAIQNNPLYKRMYVAHVRTIAEEFFSSGEYATIAAGFQNLIDAAVSADTNAFFTYNEFQNSMATDYVFGSYTVPGLSNLVENRMTYLSSTTEFQYTQPTIGTISVSDPSPLMGSTFTLTVEVTNAVSGGVYLGYRGSYQDAFTRMLLFDDGAHNDGASGDNVYGNQVTMATPYMQYYIYAENANAGIFSPQRAEHEYYTLGSNVQPPVAGTVVVNEFLAINTDNEENEYFEKTDWIELYNTTASPVSLYGLFLSDDPENPMKFAFPEDAVIPASGYLAVWADEQTSTDTYLHANFKLSGSGEHILLSDYTGTILDSLSYGQQTEDVSTGRCPDGTGSFGVLEYTSFLTSNCVAGVGEVAGGNIRVYPNPAQQYIIIETPDWENYDEVRCYNAVGQVMKTVSLSQVATTLDLTGFSSGVYVLFIGESNQKRIVIR